MRSEQSLGDSPIPIQADYALDGQFVSNWDDILLPNSWWYTKRKRSTLFLKQYVEFIALHFVISLLIQYTAIGFVINLFYIVFLKLIQHYESKYTQNPNSLYIGVRICLILFGIAMIGTELYYMNNFNSDHFLVNPLNTKLSCWNFNLVNADQFSRE